MRKVFSPALAFSALLLFCAGAARTGAQKAEPGAPAPPAPCDDASKTELYKRFRENHKGSPEQQMEAYKEAQEYVCRCADYDDITLYISNWLHRYDPDVAYPNAEAAAAALAREDAKRPRCRCDEMREKLVGSLKQQDRHEHSQQNHDTVKRFLKICGDGRRPIDRYLYDWLTKYDKAVREFEERRQKGEGPAAKGPAKEQ